MSTKALSALHSAVSKITIMNALSRQSILGAGSPAFVKLNERHEPSASGRWFSGTVRSVTDVERPDDDAGDDENSTPHDPVRRVAVDLDTVRGVHVEILDSTDTNVFHANRTRGWRGQDATNPVANDLCAVPDCHEATMALSFDNFANDSSCAFVNIGGNEAVVVKGEDLHGIGPNGIRAPALERTVVVAAGVPMRRDDPLQLLRLLWSSYGTTARRLLPNFAVVEAAVGLLSYVYAPDTFALELAVVSDTVSRLRPFFGHIDAKASALLATPSGGGRVLEAAVRAFADVAFVDAIEQPLKWLRAANQLHFLPISTSGLKPSQEEGLAEVTELSGIPTKAFKTQFYPQRGSTTATAIDEAKALFVAGLVHKAVHALFRGMPAAISGREPAWRLLALPPPQKPGASSQDSQSTLARTQSMAGSTAAQLASALTGDPKTGLAQLCLDVAYGALGAGALTQHGIADKFGTRVVDAGRLEAIPSAVAGSLHMSADGIATRMGDAAKGAAVPTSAAASSIPSSGGVAAARSAFGGSSSAARAAFEQPQQAKPGVPRAGARAANAAPPTPALFAQGQGRDREFVFVRHPFGTQQGKYSVSRCAFHFRSLNALQGSNPPPNFAEQLKILSAVFKAPHGAVFVMGTGDDSVMEGLATRLARATFTRPAITLSPTHLAALMCLVPKASDGDDADASERAKLSPADRGKKLAHVLNLPDQSHAKVTDSFTQLSVYAYGTLLTRFQKFRGQDLELLRAALAARESQNIRRVRRAQWSVAVVQRACHATSSELHREDVAEQVMARLRRAVAAQELKDLEVAEYLARETLVRDYRSSSGFLVRKSASFLGPMFHRLSADLIVDELHRRKAVMEDERRTRHQIMTFSVDVSPEYRARPVTARLRTVAAGRGEEGGPASRDGRSSGARSLGEQGASIGALLNSPAAVRSRMLGLGTDETLARVRVEGSCLAQLRALHAHWADEERAQRDAAKRRVSVRKAQEAACHDFFQQRLDGASRHAEARHFVEKQKVDALRRPRDPYDVSYAGYWDRLDVAEGLSPSPRRSHDPFPAAAAASASPPHRHRHQSLSHAAGFSPPQLAPSPATAPAPSPRAHERVVPPHYPAFAVPAPALATAHATTEGRWAGPVPHAKAVVLEPPPPASPERVVPVKRMTWGNRRS